MPVENTEYVLVTEYFHPDTASTGQLMTDLAVGLQDRGLDMTVLTGQPNYHSGDNVKQPRVSEHQDVTVKRIRAPQVRQSSLPRRLFNWAVFTLWSSLVLLLSRPKKERELIFVSNPPFLPPALWVVCRLRGWDYTHIVYDLYPDFLVETGFFSEDHPLVKAWSWLYERVLRDADSVVALGPVMRERLLETANGSLDPDDVVIIHNWEDGDFIQPLSKDENWFSKEHGLENQFTLLYSGNIGENHDLESIIEAAATLEEKSQVHFAIIGEGDKKSTIVDLARERGVKDSTVSFLPYQPLDELRYSLTAGDVSIVTVQEGMEGICVSSKLYTALAAGQPVLVISQEHDDEARIVNECSAGFQMEQGDVEGIVEVIHKWRDNPSLVEEQGHNAREAFEKAFTKSHSIDRYYKLLTDGAHLNTRQLSTSDVQRSQRV